MSEAELQPEPPAMPLNVAGPAFEALRVLWEAGSSCDVTLRAGSGSKEVLIPCHSVVLASISAYFRGLFAGAGCHMQHGMPNPNTAPGSPNASIVNLPACEPQQLLAVVTAIYTQQLQVSAANVQQLMTCSDFLGVTVVMDACCEFLTQQLDVHTCLATLQLAVHFKSQQLLQKTMAFACANFKKLVAVVEGAESDQWTALTKDTLLQLLSAETLQAASEVQVAQVAVSWLDMWPAALHADLAEVLSTVRLPPSRFISEIESGEIHMASSACRRALLAHLHDNGVQGRLPPPRHKLPVGLIAAGGHDPSWHCLRNTEVYQPKEDAWTAGPLLQQGYSFATGAILEGSNEAFVVGGATHSSCVSRLPHVGAAWTQCQPCLAPRLHAACAATDRLFVLGGRTGIVATVSTESFHPAEQRWQSGPDMIRRRTALAAATLQDEQAIMAVGGQDVKQVHNCAERLDLATGRSSLLSCCMACERKYTSCTFLDGRLYVVAGMDATRTRLSSVEALDPREGCWTTLPALQQARASCGTAVLQGELYVTAGSGSDDTILSSVEAFSPTAGRWRPCAPLNLARSNLALLPLCEA